MYRFQNICYISFESGTKIPYEGHLRDTQKRNAKKRKQTLYNSLYPSYTGCFWSASNMKFFRANGRRETLLFSWTRVKLRLSANRRFISLMFDTFNLSNSKKKTMNLKKYRLGYTILHTFDSRYKLKYFGKLIFSIASSTVF